MVSSIMYTLNNILKLIFCQLTCKTKISFFFIAGEPLNIELIEGEDGELLISIPINEAPQKIPQYYGFSKGRHSGSFFLKIGGAIFCAMHIIHLTLLIAKEVLICEYINEISIF